MKHAELREGMTIKAVADYADCWRAGDEFVVHMDTGEGHAPLPYIECHTDKFHGLDAMDDGDGELPEFEPAKATA